jgi:hypothetical protein
VKSASLCKKLESVFQTSGFLICQGEASSVFGKANAKLSSPTLAED